MTKALNLIGERFGKLTVINRGKNSKHGKTQWLCKCECGNSVVAVGSDLKLKKYTSCGCSKRTHGLSNHRLYGIFGMMKDRCHNPNNVSYPWYGGEGIKIYQEWLDDYTKFHEWALQSGYKENLEIDRIDSKKDYSPDNCRWVTRLIQTHNQRPMKGSKSGIRGVKWNKARKKWEVTISFKGKRHYLGLFEELDKAAETRKRAEEKYW